MGRRAMHCGLHGTALRIAQAKQTGREVSSRSQVRAQLCGGGDKVVGEACRGISLRGRGAMPLVTRVGPGTSPVSTAQDMQWPLCCGFGMGIRGIPMSVDADL